MRKNKFRISFNAPAVLGFTALCLIAQILNLITAGGSNRTIFSVYRASLLDPLTWVRCFAHVAGHVDWSHLIGNMMYILILGPMLEEKYGTRNLIWVMVITAGVTGLLNMLLFPDIRLLGASGIVFAMIVLASITVKDNDAIPLTFILVVALYLGQQIYEGLFTKDNVSQLAHIAGGVMGAVLGYLLNRGGTRTRYGYRR